MTKTYQIEIFSPYCRDTAYYDYLTKVKGKIVKVEIKVVNKQ